MSDSRTAEKFVVRMPDGMRDQLSAQADAEFTSMNALFVKALDQYLNNSQKQEILLQALEEKLQK